MRLTKHLRRLALPHTASNWRYRATNSILQAVRSSSAQIFNYSEFRKILMKDKLLELKFTYKEQVSFRMDCY